MRYRGLDTNYSVLELSFVVLRSDEIVVNIVRRYRLHFEGPFIDHVLQLGFRVYRRARPVSN